MLSERSLSVGHEAASMAKPKVDSVPVWSVQITVDLRELDHLALLRLEFALLLPLLALALHVRALLLAAAG